METQSKYYLSTDRYKELLDDYIRDKKELAELLGVHPYHTFMVQAVQDLLEEVSNVKPRKRIRCFCEKEPKDQTFVWEFYEDGSAMFFSDDQYPEGNPCPWYSPLSIERAEEMVKCNHWIEYEAWELDEPEELYAKRIRCFSFIGGVDVVWEVYEDGKILYFSPDCPEGKIATWSAESLENYPDMLKWDAWEVDEPLPSDYPKYTLRHNE